MKVKKQHLRIAIGVLILGAAWSAWIMLGPSLRSTAQAINNERPMLQVEPQRGAQSTVEHIDPASIPAPPPIELTKEPAGTRDPFLFGNESRDVHEASMGDGTLPVVRAILFSESRCLAIIESRTMGVGDTVGDYRITAIERDAVTFMSKTGERRRVTLTGPSSAGLKR